MGRRSNARERILDAASHLLWENGCCCVTVDDICVRAGVLKGSFYHFFESKSALVAAAIQHSWENILKPAYERHFSRNHPPLERIENFLQWVQQLQVEQYRTFGRVLGWPFFTLGCELGAREPAIARKLCELESAELRYLESAIRDAIAQEAIEPCVARTEAILLRAAIAGILARARMLDDPDELSALTALPITVLRLKPAGKEMALPEDEGCCGVSEML